jgi:hypothetical protein
LKPSLDFSVQKNKKPIIEIAPGNTVSTGIRYANQVRGIVPDFEEYDAMIMAGYNTIEWKELNYMEKADAVAYMRLKKLIELHSNDAVQRNIEKMRNKGKKR